MLRTWVAAEWEEEGRSLIIFGEGSGNLEWANPRGSFDRYRWFV